MRRQKENDWGLEDALDLGFGSEVRELPLHRGSLTLVGISAALVVAAVTGRMLWLGVAQGSYYQDLASMNVNYAVTTDAPRGVITDINGKVLADNVPSFSLQLDVRAFLKESEEERRAILDLVAQQVGVQQAEAQEKIESHLKAGRGEALTLYAGLTEQQAVAVRASKRPAISVREGYQRSYPYGAAAAHVIGYTGPVSADDLEDDSTLAPFDVIGRQGVEAQYDDVLRGKLGMTVQARDAKGSLLGDERTTPALSGAEMQVTIDAELQKYAYDRLKQQLDSLQRTRGAVVITDPRSGAVRTLVSLPSYDPAAFTQSGRSDERVSYLTSPERPLYDRVTSGAYTPGSTIKPLHGIAALSEGVVDPDWSIFSPGYLDIPNPWNPDKPTRYVDWRFQGTINVRSAIAQSSNVYFYAVGGGTGGLKGLGVSRLHAWWEKFLLGEKTGIDLPSEGIGFLPSADWKEEQTGTPWLLGDTYNISIGQGDLTLTPIQLVNYIATVANGGKVYRPFVNASTVPEIRADLSQYGEAFKQAQMGMRQTVTADLGTAHTMTSLPFAVAGKTGSAQINNNAKENAFFVGYAPYENPEIAIAVLVEDSVHGSLNAVPVAQDIFNFWYQQKNGEKSE